MMHKRKRDPDELQMYSVKLPVDLIDRVNAVRRAEGRTMQVQMARLIEAGLAQCERPTAVVRSIKGKAVA